VIIKDVLLVEGLKHSLLSINQLCDRGYKITFEPECYYSHKNKDLIKPNKTKQARQSKQAIGGDLGFGLV